MPLFQIEPITWRAPDAGQFDALLLTSANAVRVGGPGLAALRDLPVHAVGEATAAAAREAGFDVATVGYAGVERLVGALDPKLRLLHLAGEHGAASIAAGEYPRRLPLAAGRAAGRVGTG